MENPRIEKGLIVGKLMEEKKEEESYKKEMVLGQKDTG